MHETGFLRNACDSNARALYDANTGEWFTRAQLTGRVSEFAARLQFPRKALGFCFPLNDSESLIAYLAAVAAGHAVAMLNPELDAALNSKLIERFQPDFIVAPRAHPPDNIWLEIGAYSQAESPYAGQFLLRSTSPNRHPIHPDLTLLNSTSGSTGSPKLVRLSWRNLECNAGQINHLLRSTPQDCTMLTAPIFNAYGQSAIHTMLSIGGSLVLSRERLMSRAYWDGVRHAGCNAIGGTSYFYEVLDRLDLDLLDVPRLTKFGHSGSRLSEHLIRKFHGAIARRGGTLHLMYGQAETTARISGLPPELLPEASRSVGFVVPGGQVRIERDSVECGPMEEGELVYAGANVMMGYATSPQDLALGDTQGGIRQTGDIGYKDERGLIYITGRKARLVKLYGWRVSLDDVEDLLAPAGPVAAVNEQERVVIYAERASAALHQAVRDLAARMNLHPSGFQVRAVAVIPRLANGKVDYKSLSSHSAPEAWKPAPALSVAD